MTLEWHRLVFQVIHGVVYGVSFFFFRKYAHLRPLSERVHFLMFLSTLGSGFIGFTWFFDLNCPMLVVTRNLYIPMLYLPIFLRIRRLHLKFIFEETIEMSNSKLRLRNLLMLKRKTSNRYMLMVYGIALFPHVAVMIDAFISIEKASDFKDFDASYEEECHETETERTVQVLTALGYSVYGFYSSRKIRGSADEWGIQYEMRVFLGVFFVSAVLMFGLRDIFSWYPTVHIWSWNIWLQYWFVVRPTYHTWKSLRKSVVVDTTNLELIAVLGDPEGFATFHDHVRSEFSSENLSFWVRSGEFIGATQDLVAAAKALVEEYIADSAPLQVNVSSAIQKTLVARLAAGDVSSSMFEEAREEVYKLMVRDSFPRYKAGPHFTRYDAIQQKRRMLSSTGGGGGDIMTADDRVSSRNFVTILPSVIIAASATAVHPSTAGATRKNNSSSSGGPTTRSDRSTNHSSDFNTANVN